MGMDVNNWIADFCGVCQTSHRNFSSIELTTPLAVAANVEILLLVLMVSRNHLQNIVRP